ncbi:hypothetical protein AB833_18320 [Chromatiales bacterium (ex Bugula neritina AB1)]|nr:hypothetical protein AB833_18320 [Chromatiales bacterium (ex Bugula neritina AB1)]
MDVLVVGAGVSGLTAAVQCRAAGYQVMVVEDMESIGGRVKSATIDGDYVGDLGPSWVWPPWQPVAARWIADLGIEMFPQFEEGTGLLDFPGQVERHPLPGQHGIARLTGGPQSIVGKLSERLGDRVIRCGVSAQTLVKLSNGIEVHLQTLTDKPDTRNQNDSIVQARHVIVAVPVRVALETIQFEPGLPPDFRRQMAETPTWMATQAKVVVHYPKAFWREDGLSGRVASRVGPLVEIHDHCGSDGSPAALFGFMGLTLEQRQKHRDALPSLIIEQLRRCFGEQATTPTYLWIEDWALTRSVCSATDCNGEAQHPEVRPAALRQALLGGKVHFATAELATESPGLINGALVAGEAAAEAVLKSRN